MRKGIQTGKSFIGLQKRVAITLLLIILLLIQACSLSTQSSKSSTADGATVYPTLENQLASPQPADQSAAMIAGMPAISQDMTHYTLQVDIDDSGQAFEGTTRIDYVNTEIETLNSLYFRLYPNLGQTYGNGKITIRSAVVDGQQASIRQSDFDSIVEVILEDPLAPGDRAQIDIETSGTIPVDFGGDSNNGYGIYNYSKGIVALANFYPILAVYDSGGWRLDPVYSFGDAVYSEAALYTVEVLTRPEMILATTGVEVSQKAVDDKTLHRYISGPARDFFIIASPDYKVTSRQVDGITVNSYYLPDHAGDGAQALETAAQALERFITQFGPYPYKEYDVVEAPLNRPLGVEYPGLGLISEKLYEDSASPNFDTTIAHEVAHQWWYNVVGNDVIRDPWIDEALATYSSILYWEQIGGFAAREQVVAYYQGRYDQNTEDGLDAPVTEGMAYFQENDRSGSYGAVVYAKGGLFFEELRGKIGDEAFFNALQEYYAAYWFSVAPGDALLTAFQRNSSVQLDDFYRTWLYSAEITGPTQSPD